MAISLNDQLNFHERDQLSLDAVAADGYRLISSRLYFRLGRGTNPIFMVFLKS